MIRTITAVYLRAIVFASVLICVLCSMLFYSCGDEALVHNPPAPSSNDYFNWSVECNDLEGITSISGTVGVNPIYAVNAIHTIFTGGIKNYKITNGTKHEINLGDEKFVTSEVKALDENYAIFLGYKNFPPDSAYIKIYDNGHIKNYSTPLAQGDYLQEIFIIDRDNFFIANDGGLSYYEFKNNVFKQHLLPNNFTPVKFIKMNNELYLTARYEINSFNAFFKIGINREASLIRTEEPYGRLFFLNNDIIKVIEDNMFIEFHYFTSNGWTKFYSAWNNSNGEKILHLAGSSKDFFSSITVDNQYNIHANVWNGTEYSEQDNFPIGLTAFNTLGKVSEFNSNSFYFYHAEAKRLLKAVKIK